MAAGSGCPLSFSPPLLNSRQETGSSSSDSAAKMLVMDSRMAPIAIRGAVRKAGIRMWLLLFLLQAAQWLAGHAFAEAALVEIPRVTLIVFAERQMPDAEWASLFAALQHDFGDLALESRALPAGIDLMRGETSGPGVHVDNAITVYLHGECNVAPQPARGVVEGALGWVYQDHGYIAPYIHVDCTRISQLVGPHALGAGRNRRSDEMAEAISRVILHEFVHVATQSAAHKPDGISKRSFGIADLIPDWFPRGAHAGHGK